MPLTTRRETRSEVRGTCYAWALAYSHENVASSNDIIAPATPDRRRPYNMALKFSSLVELLRELDAARAKKAVTTSRAVKSDHNIVVNWFKKYNASIERQGLSATALLACLFPERLPERSYLLKETRLVQVFGRALGLGATRHRQLKAWTTETGDDFATCVEAVMAQCENDIPSPGREITIEDIDQALLQIAANLPNSSPKIKKNRNACSTHDILGPILRSLRSYEARWLVRMILKDYAPVKIPEYSTMFSFHFLLPDILSVQNSFEAAVDMLAKPSISKWPVNPEKAIANHLRVGAALLISPQMGVMIKRQPYDKARSIKHCCKMANSRVMSVERKYDGEYCQVHINLEAGSNAIQIFSKSGKDSTNDRVRLHGAIQESLRLDRDGCKIRSRCILEGELLVWSTSKQHIEPFHKIRRHVLHGGRTLGMALDSPRRADEQVMIMYYDLLLLDAEVMALQPQEERRKILKGLVETIPGVSGICERKLINFGSSRAKNDLRDEFATSIKSGWEGFVLKASNEPYFSWKSGSRSIKLKKDLMGLGETADLCIVGARRDAGVVAERQMHDIRWTHFYVASIENKEDHRRFAAKPQFQIINVLDPNGIPKAILPELNLRCEFSEIPFAMDGPEMSISLATRREDGQPKQLFKRPLIVEIMGAAFDKPSNRRDWTLRFPRLTKIHDDRGLQECLSFTELQELAEKSMGTQAEPDTQEDAMMLQRLIKADGKLETGLGESQSTSPGTTPRSATTISLTPVSTRRPPPPPPPFVRADSAELTSQELLTRQYGSQSTRSPSVSPSMASSTRSKRKASVAHTSPLISAMKKRQRLVSVPESPTPGRVTRHVRIAPIPQAKPVILDNLDGAPRDSETHTGCSTRSSTTRLVSEKHPTSSPTTSHPTRPVQHETASEPYPSAVAKAVLNDTTHQSPSSAEVRPPLAEVINLSPEMSRSTLPRESKSPTDKGKQPTTSTSVSVQLTKPIAQHQNACSGFPFLPTPSSSGEPLRVDELGQQQAQPHAQPKGTTTSTTAAAQTTIHLHGPPIRSGALIDLTPPSTAPQTPHQQSSLLATRLQLSMPKPILLGASLTSTTAGLYDLLCSYNSSFTYSPTHFLKHLDADLLQPGPSHCASMLTYVPRIVLVDNSHPCAVAEDIAKLSQQLVNDIKLLHEEEVRVLFMDYHFLQLLGHEAMVSLPGTDEDEDKSEGNGPAACLCRQAGKEYFSGGLLYRRGMADLTGRRRGVVVWDWDELWV